MSRDRYLWNAGEDTIHDPKEEKVELTPKQKRQNFWYYYKWPILIGVIVTAVAAWFIYDLVTKVSPDYNVSFITKEAYPTQITERLQKALEERAEDLNGDGQVVVTVNQYTQYDDTESGAMVDPNMQMANQTRMMADFSSAESMIFILDEDTLKGYMLSGDQLFLYKDGTQPPENATDVENVGYLWSELPFFTGLDLTFSATDADGNSQTYDLQQDMENLHICLRAKIGSAGEEKKQDYYEACQRLFDSFLSATEKSE